MSNDNREYNDAERVQTGEQRNDIIAGRNAVREAILNGRAIDSIMIAKGERQGSLRVITELARERGIPIREVSPIKLDSLCPGGRHQGGSPRSSARAKRSSSSAYSWAAVPAHTP